MIHEERGAPLPERPLESVCRQGGLRPHGLDTTLETYGGGVPGGDRRAEIPWRTTIAPGRTDMGSALPKAKTRPVSWNALEKIEPFTQEVKAQLEILKSRRRAKVFPNDALSGEMLDKVIMSIWCVCYGGMQWRTIGLLTGIPFTTMYSCFARWNRLGLWKGLVVDLLRRCRVACGDKCNPSVRVADSRSCRSSPTCGKRGIDGGKKVKGIKINILVDKHGFPLAVALSTANVHDCVGIIPALRICLQVSGHVFRRFEPTETAGEDGDEGYQNESDGGCVRPVEDRIQPAIAAEPSEGSLDDPSDFGGNEFSFGAPHLGLDLDSKILPRGLQVFSLI